MDWWTAWWNWLIIAWIYLVSSMSGHSVCCSVLIAGGLLICFFSNCDVYHKHHQELVMSDKHQPNALARSNSLIIDRQSNGLYTQYKKLSATQIMLIMFWLEKKMKNKFNLCSKQWYICVHFNLQYMCGLLIFPWVHESNIVLQVLTSIFVCCFSTVYNSNTNLHFKLKLWNNKV